MTQDAPGKSFRKGLDYFEFMELFPTEDSAREWFETWMWPHGRCCPSCGSAHTITMTCTTASSPYYCQSCQKQFSVKTNSLMHNSPLPYRKWLWAVYLHMTSLKGVSSMKLHRDIKVTQKTAWFMLQRIREAFRPLDLLPPMRGPVEVDETHVGGKRRNKSNAERRAATGRGFVDMTTVVGAKDRETNAVRAEVIATPNRETLIPFVERVAARGAPVYTDEASAYTGLASDYDHARVNHSANEYVRDTVHTNGIESFWSMLKRAHKGVYHKFSRKHLQRYVTDFSGRHNVREHDTLNQMCILAMGMGGRRLPYKLLIADNGLWSGANGGVRV